MIKTIRRPCTRRHPVPVPEACDLCWLFEFDQRYRTRYEGEGPAKPVTCPRPFVGAVRRHGPPPPDRIALPRVRIKECRARNCHDWVTVDADGAVTDSGSSPSRALALRTAAHALRRPETWACGLTTVGEATAGWEENGWAGTRQARADLLKRTLASTFAAGFPEPFLFVDGARSCEYANATCRHPAVLTWANWWLGFQELVARNPDASRYVMFQDDLVCPKNLRLYLECREWPADPPGYLNLYTHPENEGSAGWHEAPEMGAEPYALRLQGGRGAVALVFNREAAVALLTSEHAARKCLAPQPEIRHKRADGGVVNAMNHAGYREWVHSPSLVQHTGLESSMGNGRWGQSASFPGEDFDALELLL